MQRLLPPLLLTLALSSLTVVGPGDETMHWFWNRVAARLSGPVVALAFGASLLAMALPRPIPWPIVAILGYAPFALAPQSAIDTALYAEHALRGAREGLFRLLWQWPTRVWGAADETHRHMPLVPLVYAAVMALGLPWRLANAAWSGLLAFAAHRLGGPRAAVLLLGVPFLWAQSGLFLVDVPAAAMVALALANLDARRPAAAGLALLVKSSVGAFLLGPALALALRPWESRRRAAILGGIGALALVALFGAVGHHLRPPMSYVSAARSLFVQLTPWILAPAVLGLFAMERRRAWLLAAGLAAAIVLLRYAPAGHIARYALPLVPILCAAAAAAMGDRAANAVAAFGLVLGLAAYRPLAWHHQAANLDMAVRAIPEDARGVEIVADYQGEGIPPWFLAPIAQLSTPARVVYRGAVTPPKAATGRPVRWWSVHTPDPYFQEAILVDHRLVVARVGTPVAPGWVLVSVHDRYQGSSFTFPPRVLLFSRRQATSTPPIEE